MKILVINPGSTSTKIAVFEDEKQVWIKNIHHSADELKEFTRISDQYDYRKNYILAELKEAGYGIDFDAVIGRGGLLHPISGGVYHVNEKMCEDLRNAKKEHASNLGALIAAEIAVLSHHCPAFIADPVVVDELQDVARVSGLSALPRISIFHALNQKAVARRFAAEQGKKYEEMDLIVAHLGGGISVGAHHHGRVIDVNNALDGEGPFSPERAGTLPAGQLVDLCFSGQYTQKEIKKMISGKGGLVDHLGTNDSLKAEQAAEAGDRKAILINEAMMYGVAKSIGAMHAVLKCKTEAILVTGGIAYSKPLMAFLKEFVQDMAPVHVYPGEDEMGALALNALNVLRGEFAAQEYR